MSLKIEIKNYGQLEWSRIINEFDGLSLMQTWEYAEAKSKLGSWKTARMLFMDGDVVAGAAQCSIKSLPLIGRGLVWVNQGPLFAKGGKAEPQKLIEMLKGLKQYWADKNKMYLCAAPPISAGEIDQKLIEEIGYKNLPEQKGWESAVINLGRSEEELRKRLYSNWRNHLNKAEKLGLECEIGESPQILEELLGSYSLLIEKKKLNTAINPQFIRQLQNILPQGRKMTVFIAREGKKCLGGILIARYGKTCIYFVGAVTDEGKKLQANYFLLWRAICHMKRENFEVFDVGGASPELTPEGILQFKNGLGGEKYKLIGEFEAYENTFASKGIRWLVNKVRGAK